jgi:hypothetical protein
MPFLFAASFFGMKMERRKDGEKTKLSYLFPDSFSLVFCESADENEERI